MLDVKSEQNAARYGLRRLLPILVAGVFVCVGLLFAPVERVDAARVDPAAKFMQRVANDLQAAGRLGSRNAFHKSIQKYADISYIGTVSLGVYLPKLKKSKKKDYYNGVKRFMAKYFAIQSRNYKVTKAQILSQSKKQGRNILVDSRVYLSNGKSYKVTWKLVRSGKSYRVQDARVLGFWLTPFLRDAFVGYVKQNRGNVNSLIVALKR
ncbi:MAG: ABC transporter substrate-binding protein [Hyphomicrobiales bacterium]